MTENTAVANEETTNEPTPTAVNPETPVEPQTQTSVNPDEKKVVQIVYILQALGFVFGLTFIAAVIVNYVKRGDMESDFAKSHMSFQIRTFWWSTIWSVLSIILTFVIIGYVTLFINFAWTLYRVIRGFIKMNENKPA